MAKKISIPVSMLWHFWLSATAVLSVVFDVYLCDLYDCRLDCLIICILSILAMSVLEIHHYRHFREPLKTVKLRIFSDMALFGAGALITNGLENFLIPSYLGFLTMSFLLVVYCFDCSTVIIWYLRIITVIIIAFSVFRYPALHANGVVIFFTANLLLVSFVMEMMRKLDLRKQKELAAIQGYTASMMHHNLNNFINTVKYMVDRPQTQRTHDMIHNAIEGIEQMSNAFVSRETAFNLRKVAANISLFCRRNFPNVHFADMIDQDINLHSNLSVLFNALLIVVSNACESGSKKVTLTSSGTVLEVTDEGTGFDPSKIKEGYTTKPKGHGQGLINAINSCKINRTPITIDSQVGKGTTVSFDLSQVVMQ